MSPLSISFIFSCRFFLFFRSVPAEVERNNMTLPERNIILPLLMNIPPLYVFFHILYSELAPVCSHPFFIYVTLSMLVMETTELRRTRPVLWGWFSRINIQLHSTQWCSSSWSLKYHIGTNRLNCKSANLLTKLQLQNNNLDIFACSLSNVFLTCFEIDQCIANIVG
jgi:hypothetical protein